MSDETRNRRKEELLAKLQGVERDVCLEIAERQQFGIEKYGQTVAENPLTLVEWLRHAFEESLDFPIYLKRAIREIENQEREVDDRIATHLGSVQELNLDPRISRIVFNIEADFYGAKEQMRTARDRHDAMLYLIRELGENPQWMSAENAELQEDKAYFVRLMEGHVHQLHWKTHATDGPVWGGGESGAFLPVRGTSYLAPRKSRTWRDWGIAK